MVQYCCIMCNMTMHLVKGVYLPKKTKKKSKKIDTSAMELEWRKYNKEMRRTHCHHLQYSTLQEYIDYRLGKTKKHEKKFQAYIPPPTYVRDQKEYASAEAEGVSGHLLKTRKTRVLRRLCSWNRNNAQVKPRASRKRR